MDHVPVDPRQAPKRWGRLAVLVGIALAAFLGGAMSTEPKTLSSWWPAGGEDPAPDEAAQAEARATFDALTRQADRIIVRNGHMHARGKVFAELSDRAALDEVATHLAFERMNDSSDWCKCAGYPVVEWRRGDEVLAAVTLHHAISVRGCEGWFGWGGLTPDSRTWMTSWLVRCGVPLGPPDDPAVPYDE